MYWKQTLIALAVGVAMIPLPAFSQEEGLGRNNITVQAFGSFVTTTTKNGIQESATNSGGVMGTYGFFFDNHNGAEVNYGYSLNTQSYGLSGGPFGVKSYSHEISADYVFRYPLKHWTPFALGGAAALIFDPDGMPGIGSQARAAFVYGGGANFTLSAHTYVRAEYRGFVYDSPTWDLPGINGVDRFTHRAEPSIGFGYRF